MKKISLLLTMLILFSCQSKTDKKQYQISEETKSEQLSKSEPTSSLSKDLNKKIDDFLFVTIETGWLKSTRREGVMYVSARLLVKNISKNEITDIPVLQNQITFNVIKMGLLSMMDLIQSTLVYYHLGVAMFPNTKLSLLQDSVI